MTKKIDLTPGGGTWCEVREASELNAGDRRAVRAAASFRVDPEAGEAVWPGDYNDKLTNALAARVIVNWNLVHPIPSRGGGVEVLDELSIAQWDALRDGIAEQLAACQEDAPDAAVEGSVPTSDSAI